jgi:uncharacterized membrane protein (UPF0127 family)
MQIVRVRNLTRDNILCEQCEVATSLWARTRGLMGRSTLGEGEGLWIVRCPSIHMFNMKFAIDAVFVTRDNIVTDIAAELARGKTYVAHGGAGKPVAVIELPAGSAARNGTCIGDALACEPFEADS